MTTKVFFCFFVSLTFVSANVIPCQYAKFDPNHSGCKEANPKCDIKQRNVTAYDIHVIISTHNHLRQKVAVGNESGQPPAANMKVLKWDPELAFIAQKLADQCRNQRDCDDCREVDRFPVGQQLRLWRRSSISGLSNDSLNPNWEETISSWYKAVSFFNSGLIKQYTFTISYGTYSQLVWANTSYVGCGYAAFKEGNMDEKLYVCNYGPAGNMLSEEMYKVGPACESCPENWSCSQQYPGLCAENQMDNPRVKSAPSDEATPLVSDEARDEKQKESENPTTNTETSTSGSATKKDEDETETTNTEFSLPDTNVTTV